jgi:hypothetical protein
VLYVFIEKPEMHIVTACHSLASLFLSSRILQPTDDRLRSASPRESVRHKPWTRAGFDGRASTPRYCESRHFSI